MAATLTKSTPEGSKTASPKKKSGKAKSTTAKSPGKAEAGGKSRKASPPHPPTSQMILSAVEDLNEQGGSSLAAIKTYISSYYDYDVSKKSLFICKAIKTAVANGTLLQTKGTGAAGSFKLPAQESSVSLGTTSRPVKKKPAEKPVSSAKKTASKAKKVKKPPTTPKAPKPKKVKAKSSSAKKTSPAKPKAVRKKKATPKKK